MSEDLCESGPCLRPRPGPQHWDWRCLNCSQPIRDHLPPWQRWKERRKCQHPSDQQQCIHGDEIIAAGYNRACCRRCGRLVPDLPVMCAAAGEPHTSHSGRNGST